MEWIKHKYEEALNGHWVICEACGCRVLPRQLEERTDGHHVCLVCVKLEEILIGQSGLEER